MRHRICYFFWIFVCLAVSLPAVEVHLSDLRTREAFRQISYPGLACLKTYMGLGFEGYRQGILFLKSYLKGEIEA